MWQDDDENLKTEVCQACSVCDPLILIICPTCVLVFIKFYYTSHGTQQKHCCGILKTFLPLKDLTAGSTQSYD